MRRVVIESPYAGDVERNLRYLRACMADSLAHGETPYASHGLLTQPGVLDDNDPEQRVAGIKAGLAWHHAAHVIAFYIDLGWSDGMIGAREHASRHGLRVEVRRIGMEWDKPKPSGVHRVWCTFTTGHHMATRKFHLTHEGVTHEHTAYLHEVRGAESFAEAKAECKLDALAPLPGDIAAALNETLR